MVCARGQPWRGRVAESGADYETLIVVVLELLLGFFLRFVGDRREGCRARYGAFAHGLVRRVVRDGLLAPGLIRGSKRVFAARRLLGRRRSGLHAPTIDVRLVAGCGASGLWRGVRLVTGELRLIGRDMRLVTGELRLIRGHVRLVAGQLRLISADVRVVACELWLVRGRVRTVPGRSGPSLEVCYAAIDTDT